VRASPDESCLNNSPPPPAANTSQSPPPASGLSATSTESRATSAATHISNGGVQAYYSDLGAVPGFEADLGRRRRRKRDPRAYQSAMLGISASNGSLLWQRTFNASLAPAAVRPLPHDLGRGGLMLIDGCVPPTTYISDDSAKKNDSSRPKGSVGRGIGGSQGGSVWQEVWGLLKRAVHPPRKHHHGTTKAASEDDSAENDPWPWEQHGNAGRHTGQQGSAGSSRSGSRQSRQLRAVAGQQLEHLQEGSVGDSASTSNSENPDGTVCCLYAVVMATGKVGGGSVCHPDLQLHCCAATHACRIPGSLLHPRLPAIRFVVVGWQVLTACCCLVCSTASAMQLSLHASLNPHHHFCHATLTIHPPGQVEVLL
jgi:hypothetical protein